MEPKGTALIVANPQNTTYHFGKLSELAGQVLTVVDRNERGDCLCLIGGSGLVDIHHDDVAHFQPALRPVILDAIRKLV